MNPGLLHWELGVLITGPPGKDPSTQPLVSDPHRLPSCPRFLPGFQWGAGGWEAPAGDQQAGSRRWGIDSTSCCPLHCGPAWSWVTLWMRPLPGTPAPSSALAGGPGVGALCVLLHKPQPSRLSRQAPRGDTCSEARQDVLSTELNQTLLRPASTETLACVCVCVCARVHACACIVLPPASSSNKE